MDFDPDKYLAEHDGGFDPDAYLAAHDKPSPSRGSPSRPREYSDASLGLDPGLAPTAKQTFFSTMLGDQPVVPPQARPWAPAGAPGQPTGQPSTDQQLEAIPADVRSPEATERVRRARMNRNNPVADDWIAQNTIGSIVGGAAGKVAGPLFRAALGKLAPAAAAALEDGGALAEGAGTVAKGSIEGGVNSKAQGGDAAPGAVVGGSLAALGPLGRAIVNSKGGQARQFIEARDGKVDVLSPGRGGPFEQMDVPVNSTTDAQIGQQAAVSAERGLGMLKKERDAALKPTGQLIEQINNSPAGRAKRGISDLVPQLQDAVGAFGTSSSTEGELQRVLGKIEAHQKPGFNADVHPYELSEADLNLAKRDLDRAARTGTSNAEQLSPLKKAANATRAMVDEGPYKIPNEMYANDAFKYRQSRRLLGISERPTAPDETQNAINTVKNRITRRGQNTVTAGADDPRLQAFEKRHHDIGLELSKPALLRARGDLSFRMLPKEHGGLIDRGSSVVSTVAAAEALAGLMGHGHTSPLKIALGLLGAAATKNATAIEGRLLYPGAKALSGGEAENLIPLFTAAQAAQERK